MLRVKGALRREQIPGDPHRFFFSTGFYINLGLRSQFGRASAGTASTACGHGPGCDFRLAQGQGERHKPDDALGERLHPRVCGAWVMPSSCSRRKQEMRFRVGEFPGVFVVGLTRDQLCRK